MEVSQQRVELVHTSKRFDITSIGIGLQPGDHLRDHRAKRTSHNNYVHASQCAWRTKLNVCRSLNWSSGSRTVPTNCEVSHG